MIKKEDLKDWLNVNLRKEYEDKLEKYIDTQIKRNALNGKTSFYISTGKAGNGRAVETNFFDIWHMEELSKDSSDLARINVIQKYRDEGFEVDVTYLDCGWNTSYPAIHFKEIDKLISD